ncbi:MAG: EVE domain-containing protein [Solirubrobacteraceae bacterium]|nr:EVE domain-containing protein [Solirubrobacteraceae bacterium]
MTGPHDAGGPRRADDPAQLSELLAELQATAEQLGTQLGDLGRASADAAAQRADALPSVRKILEIAPPELRARLAAAATSGLSATRDLADWLLTQVAPAPVVPEPEELPIDRPTAPPAPPAEPRIQPVTGTTWILTASVDNHLATQARDFSVIGIKERNRNRAMEIEQGDVIVFYLTKVMSFAGAVRVTGDLFEDREKIWPGQPKNPDIYPWRMATEKVVALPESQWIPAETLKDDLEHVQKWPAEHWKLAFQGQLRTVSAHDSGLLLDRLAAAAAQTVA